MSNAKKLLLFNGLLMVMLLLTLSLTVWTPTPAAAEAGEPVSVFYNKGGGAWTAEDTPDQQQVTAGDTITLPDADDITNDGCWLVGWEDDDQLFHLPGDIITVSENTSLHTFWEDDGYTALIFQQNPPAWANGMDNDVSRRATSNDSTTLPHAYHRGFDCSYGGFVGWSTTADGTGGTIYPAGHRLTGLVAEQTTLLYAQWEEPENCWLLTLDGNYEDDDSDVTTVYVKKTDSLELDQPEDGEFLGWYDAATGGKRVGGEGDEYTPTANVTLYARWYETPEHYIHLDAGDGQDADGQNFLYLPISDFSQPVTLPDAEYFTNDGCWLVGWVDDDWSTFYLPGESVTVSENTSLHTFWEDDGYTALIFQQNPPAWANGMDNDVSWRSTSNDSTTLPHAYYSGFDCSYGGFSGWSTTADGTGGTIYPAGHRLTGLVADQTTLLYAQWEEPKNCWLLTLDGNYESGNGDVTIFYVKKGESLELDQPEDGEFLGWYDAATGGKRVGGDGDEYTPTANVTLYARWQEIPENYIKLRGNGGVDTDNGLDVKYLEWVDATTAITLPGAGSFTREGYDLVGWMGDANEYYALGEAATFNEDDYDLEACWVEKDEGYLLFHGNGGHMEEDRNERESFIVSRSVGYASCGDLELFEYEGYVASHWNSMANGTGQTYYGNAADVIDVNELNKTQRPLTLYVQWVLQSECYLLTIDQNYMPDDDQTPTTEIKYVIPDQKIYLSEHYRSGYIFLGWYSAATGGTRVTDQYGFYTPSVDNATVYAHWQQLPENFLYLHGNGGVNPNGNSFAYLELSGDPPAAVELGATDVDDFTKDDYWLVCWSGGDLLYLPNQTVEVAENTYLHAWWADNGQRGVIYHQNPPAGVTGLQMAPGMRADFHSQFTDQTTATALAVTATDFDCSGLTFQGWNTQIDGKGDMYQPGATLTLTANQALHLYAQWDAPQVPEKYLRLNAGPGHAADSSYTYGYLSIEGKFPAQVQLPAADAFVYDGYWLMGWEDEEDHFYLPGTSLSIEASGQQLSARWVENGKAAILLRQNLPDDVAFAKSVGKGYTTLPHAVGKDFDRSGWGFVNWNTKADGSGVSYEAGEKAALTANMTLELYAQWEDVDDCYTLTLNSCLDPGDSAESPTLAILVKRGAEVYLSLGDLEDQLYMENEEQDFAGWYTKETEGQLACADEGYYQVDDNVTLYAHWGDDVPQQPEQFICYEGNGGHSKDGKSGLIVDIAAEDAYTTLLGEDDFSRSGYWLVGWDDEDNDCIYAPGEEIKADDSLSLRAVWARNGYGAILFFNNTESDNSYYCYSLNNSSSLLPHAFELGFAGPADRPAFDCWNEAPAGNDTDYSATEAVPLLDNGEVLKLYAQWCDSGDSYQLTLNNFDGSQRAGTTYVQDGDPICLSTIYRSGYELLGWYNAPTGGELLCAATELFTPTGNTELYAHWLDLSSNYVIFHGMGGRNASGADYQLYRPNDFPYAIATFPQMTNGEYELIAWSAYHQGQPSYYPPQATNISFERRTDLYAMWGQPNDLYALYHGNGGSIVYSSGSVHIDIASSADLTAYQISGTANDAFTRPGQLIVGWSTQPNGQGDYYDEGDSIARDDTSFGHQLYAVWANAADCRTITYMADNMRLIRDNYVNNNYRTDLPEFSDSGKFCGWYTAPENGRYVGDAGDRYVPQGNVTLYARSYSYDGDLLTLDGNGGVLSDGSPRLYQTGVQTLPTGKEAGFFTKSNAYLLGWSTDPKGAEPEYALGETIDDFSGELLLYAVWSDTAIEQGATNIHVATADELRAALAQVRAGGVILLDNDIETVDQTFSLFAQNVTIDGGDNQLKGNMILDAFGAEVRHLDIIGDLTIGKRVGEGEATLRDVNITGRLIVKGGGRNSVYLISTNVDGEVSVEKISEDGEDVRLVVEEGSAIESIKVTSGSAIEINNATVNDIKTTEMAKGVSISGTFTTLTVAGGDVTLEPTASVGTVTASGGTTNIIGQAGTVTANAPVTVSGNVANLTASAPVTVSGTVEHVEVNSTVTLESSANVLDVILNNNSTLNATAGNVGSVSVPEAVTTTINTNAENATIAAISAATGSNISVGETTLTDTTPQENIPNNILNLKLGGTNLRTTATATFTVAPIRVDLLNADSIAVDIVLSGAPQGVSGYTLTLDYSAVADYLQYEDFTLYGEAIGTDSLGDDQLTLAVARTTDNWHNGVVATVNFTITDKGQYVDPAQNQLLQLTASDTPGGFTYNINDESVGWDSENIEFNFVRTQNGTATILPTPILLGDVNQDGYVAIIDVLKIMQDGHRVDSLLNDRQYAAGNVCILDDEDIVSRPNLDDAYEILQAIADGRTITSRSHIYTD